MPARTVKLYDGANAVIDAVSELEADGNTIVGCEVVGDSCIIIYEAKAKPRATKVEKRG